MPTAPRPYDQLVKATDPGMKGRRWFRFIHARWGETVARVAGSRYSRVVLFKANQGNLLQHWTLCEILGLLAHDRQDERHLLYFDAHAMAPGSQPEPGDNEHYARQRFQNCLAHLRHPQRELSSFETAWSELEPTGLPYPNSLRFVDHLWGDSLSARVCEFAPDRAVALEGWKRNLPGPRANNISVHQGCWRGALGWPDCACRHPHILLMQFDPYMIDRNREGADDGNLYRRDLTRIAESLDQWPLKNPVAVLVSTYSTQNDNALDEVGRITGEEFDAASLSLQADVRILGDGAGEMMSQVYVRGVSRQTAESLGSLALGFAGWFAAYR